MSGRRAGAVCGPRCAAGAAVRVSAMRAPFPPGPGRPRGPAPGRARRRRAVVDPVGRESAAPQRPSPGDRAGRRPPGCRGATVRWRCGRPWQVGLRRARGGGREEAAAGGSAAEGSSTRGFCSVVAGESAAATVAAEVAGEVAAAAARVAAPRAAAWRTVVTSGPSLIAPASRCRSGICADPPVSTRACSGARLGCCAAPGPPRR